jgi:hypothetical protein
MHVKTLPSALPLPIPFTCLDTCTSFWSVSALPLPLPLPVFTQTYNFLQRKLDEFERLKSEIEILRLENEENQK